MSGKSALSTFVPNDDLELGNLELSRVHSAKDPIIAATDDRFSQSSKSTAHQKNETVGEIEP
jgi:hypothetical protein